MDLSEMANDMLFLESSDTNNVPNLNVFMLRTHIWQRMLFVNNIRDEEGRSVRMLLCSKYNYDNYKNDQDVFCWVSNGNGDLYGHVYVSAGFLHACFKPVVFDQKVATSTSEPVCSCSSHDLFHFGCRCGAFKKST